MKEKNKKPCMFRILSFSLGRREVHFVTYMAFSRHLKSVFLSMQYPLSNSIGTRFFLPSGRTLSFCGCSSFTQLICVKKNNEKIGGKDEAVSRPSLKQTEVILKEKLWNGTQCLFQLDTG